MEKVGKKMNGWVWLLVASFPRTHWCCIVRPHSLLSFTKYKEIVVTILLNSTFYSDSLFHLI